MMQPERLKMQTPDLADEKFAALAALFPNAVTETIVDDKVVRAIDADILAQEINTDVVAGNEERYQFTWPDKRKAKREGSEPLSAALRPSRAESLNFDTTQNLYIEGDNLQVLKLLRETYLGKVKLIYIDPPYNTGGDFIYPDDFSQNPEDFRRRDGQFDEDGNRMVKNTESNGRFHTDWLNMMYPRLRVARDLLSDDGVIFISIDDSELDNLFKIGNEIFGEANYVACFPWRKRTAKSDVPFGVSQDFEWVVSFARSNSFVAGIESTSRKYYETPDLPGRPWRVHDMTTQRTATERPNSDFTIINPKNGDEYPVNPNAVWRVTRDSFQQFYGENRIVFPGDYDFLRITNPVLRYFKDDDAKKDGDRFGYSAVSTYFPKEVGMTQDGTRDFATLFQSKSFGYPKPTALIEFLLNISLLRNDDIVLDFFSGSATTAHAVVKLNAEDGGRRKFIMVQLPEPTGEDSEAFKSGYKNICEIGKERIRRAGKQIKQAAGDKAKTLDTGFRVLKLDSSNMKDVYYTPEEYAKLNFNTEGFIENIKPDRSDEDLLFQVMLELAILPSAMIEREGEVFSVDDGYLLACFGRVDDEVITAIAKRKPFYAAFRDGSFIKDSALVNFAQIFNTYSPDTKTVVL